MKHFARALAVIALPFAASAETFDEMFPELEGVYRPDAQALIDQLDYQTGTVEIGNGLARIELTDGFYFLGPDDADHVLTTVWGNPPAEGTLGMIFPMGFTPLDDTWGLEITFEDIGYVSDEDAASYDFSELLSEMQADTLAVNPERERLGYPTIELVGWAAEPHYDAAARKLYWAKELSFEGDPENTLNYNIRVLGRQGVLVMNFIAGIGDLAAVSAAAPEVLAMTEFTPGNTYADFDPATDKVAAYGIGGLIAGKVLAKTGMLAVALAFLKKGWIILLLPLLWLKNKVFGRKEPAPES